MREAMPQYVKRVQELAEHVRGNEQATKQSLVGPLFTLLGYDLTDPRECIPEYRVDFGPNRSIKPIDWAFLQSGHPIFIVEAKEVGKKVASYDEQLPDYFAKASRPAEIQYVPDFSLSRFFLPVCPGFFFGFSCKIWDYHMFVVVQAASALFGFLIRNFLSMSSSPSRPDVSIDPEVGDT